MLFKLITVLALQTAQSLQDIWFPIERQDQREITECVSKIYDLLPHPETRLFNLLHETRFDFFDDIIRTINSGSYELAKIKTASGVYDPYFKNELIILMIDDLTTIYETFYEMDIRIRSFLLCIYLGHDDIMEVFNEAIYSYMNIRVIVIDRNGYVYTMNRYEEHCGRNDSAKLLFHCRNFNAVEITSVYENQGIVDLMGCPMHVQFNKNPIAHTDRFLLLNQSILAKTEYKLLEEVSKSMNSSAVLHLGFSINSSKYTIYFGGLEFGSQEDSYPQFTDQYVLAVSYGKKYPKWLGSLRVFDGKLWLYILFSSSIIIISTFIIAQFANKPERYNKLTNTLMTFYCMLLAQGVREPKYLIMKIIFVVWLFFSFIILNAYGGLLLSHILHPLSEKTLNSIDDLIENGYRIHALLRDMIPVSSLFETYLNDDHDAVQFIEQDDIVEWSLDNQKVSLFLKQSEVDAIRMEFRDHLLPFHTIPLVNIYVCFQTRTNGHLYKDQVVTRTISLNEMGLTKKWMADYQIVSNFAVEDFEALTLDHLGLAFFILISGYTLAILVFVYEYCYSMYQYMKSCQIRVCD